MVVEELLRLYLPDIHCYEDLTKNFDAISQQSPTSKLWVDLLNQTSPLHHVIY